MLYENRLIIYAPSLLLQIYLSYFVVVRIKIFITLPHFTINYILSYINVCRNNHKYMSVSKFYLFTNLCTSELS